RSFAALRMTTQGLRMTTQVSPFRQTNSRAHSRSFASLRMTNVDRADKLAGAIMLSNTWIGVAELSPRADESAMGTIHRPLRVSGLLVNWFFHPHSFETQKASQCNNDQRLHSHRIHYFLSYHNF